MNDGEKERMGEGEEKVVNNLVFITTTGILLHLRVPFLSGWHGNSRISTQRLFEVLQPTSFLPASSPRAFVQ